MIATLGQDNGLNLKSISFNSGLLGLCYGLVEVF